MRRRGRARRRREHGGRQPVHRDPRRLRSCQTALRHERARQLLRHSCERAAVQLFSAQVRPPPAALRRRGHRDGGRCGRRARRRRAGQHAVASIARRRGQPAGAAAAARPFGPTISAHRKRVARSLRRRRNPSARARHPCFPPPRARSARSSGSRATPSACSTRPARGSSRTATVCRTRRRSRCRPCCACRSRATARVAARSPTTAAPASPSSIVVTKAFGGAKHVRGIGRGRGGQGEEDGVRGLRLELVGLRT